ncbi:ATP-binding cassette domain-containing protein [Deinococcus detaillensis]|uniref:ATP-binding cassette domain-containing protein n=1 Tax=Deinococcus detaillensis TaxID=2592048 RepID=A0A553UES4_9DEIO|nr:ABC transporter ATP-binding protein [Deinococcus detaillensis]TSA78700.1 ATP-binding cassette domain-containing protein [Deinococcus detaillensis]
MNRPEAVPAPPLSTHDLKLAYSAAVIVPRLNLSIKGRQVTSIIGPNGCGKSTLLRTCQRSVYPLPLSYQIPQGVCLDHDREHSYQ